MDGVLVPERSQNNVVYTTLGVVALGAIVYMASKTDLMSTVAHWVFDDTDTGNCDFDEYQRMRKEILDTDGKIQVLTDKLAQTTLIQHRIEISRDIADLESYKTELIDKYGHCSGWGNH